MSERWKTILAVVNNPFAAEQLAATKAAAIARRCDARLILFHTFMLPQPVPEAMLDSGEQIIALAARERERRLQRLARRLHQVRPVTCTVAWDYPVHEAIIREVLKVKPDVLVSESHRHGRVARWVLANTDWELIRSCPCPLWFVRSARLPRQPRVIVAVDPQHAHAKPARLDERLLNAAQTLTQQLRGRIEVVHAYQSPVSALPGTLMEPVRMPISPARAREFVERITRRVARLAERYDVPSSRCIVQEGAVSEVLAKLVRTHRAELLIMGAVSRSRLKRPFIGSTAERLIDLIDCDLLVVKPATFRSSVTRTPARL